MSLVMVGLFVSGPQVREGWAPAKPYRPSPRTAPPLELVVPTEAQHLIDLAEYSPDLVLDLYYAKTDNFVGRVLYPVARALLTRGTAAKLEVARQELLAHGYLLVIWDAYRPFSVQHIMWQAYPDATFVADPGHMGSRHNRAAAVDVSLLDLTGAPVAMPTGFDHFGAEANLEWSGHDPSVRERGLLLREIMVRAGFRYYAAEWWHFDDEEWARYPLLDLPLDVPVPAP